MKRKRFKEKIRTIEAQYLCTFRPDSNGAYSVRCPAFPEIVTSGRTLENARAMAREAIELCLEVYRDEGWRIPKADALPHRTIREIIPVKLVHV